jgi:hypothetical protein
MATKVDAILANLGLEKPANINNINYITNITDITDLTTSHIALDSNSNQQSLASPPSGLASLPASPPSSPCSDAVAFAKRKSTRKLPATWRGVKLDLFGNGVNKDGSLNLKLNISVLEKETGRQVPLMAALNSEFDSAVQRGVDTQEWKSSNHWRVVRQLRKELLSLYTDVRISKVGLKNKGGGTEMVVFVYQDRTGVWCCDYVREGEVFQFDLTDLLTPAQEKKKIIATGFHGAQVKRLLTAKELGI